MKTIDIFCIILMWLNIGCGIFNLYLFIFETHKYPHSLKLALLNIIIAIFLYFAIKR